MAGEPVLVLVVRDAEGTCYVIPHEALDEYRVPPERAATIEAAPGSDVSGFWSGLGGLVQGRYSPTTRESCGRPEAPEGSGLAPAHGHIDTSARATVE